MSVCVVDLHSFKILLIENGFVVGSSDVQSTLAPDENIKYLNLLSKLLS
jgi:hypothetical protein